MHTAVEINDSIIFGRAYEILKRNYIIRDSWIDSSILEIDFETVDLKNEKIDKGVVSYLNLLIMDQYLGVPIRRENGKVVV
ncbi:MAG: hypothetical protein ABDI07_10905, partial [Candidatus Kryptonium sp.]